MANRRLVRIMTSDVETGPRHNPGSDPWPDALGSDRRDSGSDLALSEMSGEVFRNTVTTRFKMTLRDFGNLIGVDERTVYRWANGGRPVPKYVKLIVVMKLQLMRPT